MEKQKGCENENEGTSASGDFDRSPPETTAKGEERDLPRVLDDDSKPTPAVRIGSPSPAATPKQPEESTGPSSSELPGGEDTSGPEVEPLTASEYGEEESPQTEHEEENRELGEERASLEALVVPPEAQTKAASQEGFRHSEIVERLERTLENLAETVGSMEKRFRSIEKAVTELDKKVSFIPPQVRTLSGKVEGLAVSVGHSRYRALLLGVLAIYDLVDQVLRSRQPDSGETEEDGNSREYEVLRTQLRQLLEINGLVEISAEGAFDPSLHRAVESVPCEDTSQNNRVVRVVRPGYRTEQAVLRYAEVCVGHYQPPAPLREESGDLGALNAKKES